LVCTDTAPVTPGDAQFPYVGKYYFYASQLPVPGTRIPTLDQVFELVERRHAEGVQLNIETKIDPIAPAETVGPEQFVAEIVAVVRHHRDGVERSLLQSFGWRTLAVARRVVPELRRVALVQASTVQIGQPGASAWLGGIDVDQRPYQGDIAYAATSVGADVLSPDHTILTDPVIASAHQHGQRVVPYTVNDVRTMNTFIGRGVDGLISDYPDRLRDVLDGLGIALPRPYPAR